MRRDLGQPATGACGAARVRAGRALSAALGVLGALAIATATAAPADAALTKRDRAAYEIAFRAIDDDRWDAAFRHARAAQERLPLKAVRWLCYQDDDCPATFEEIAAFVRANPDWPRRDRLARRAETEIRPGTPDQVLLDWFAEFPPQTGTGSLSYLTAVESRVEAGALPAERLGSAVRDVWRRTVMAPGAERTLRERYGALIPQGDETQRLEMLLWTGNLQSAERQARRVSKDRRALAMARIRLRRMSPGVDAAISRVEKELRDHPGLVYERLRWRRRKDRDDDAVALLEPEEAAAEYEQLRPGLWWRERAILARRAFADGLITRAYRLAADHSTTGGADFALAEWFAGWIALRYLRDPEMAFPHFRRMHEVVSYPVSLSRAAYWAGRAAEAAGKPEVAQAWYGNAAQHVTSFYGQLAARKLPARQRPAIPMEPRPTAAEAGAFAAAELPRLVRMLADAGAENTARVFADHLAERYDDPGRLTLLARLAHDVGRPDLAVRISREAIKDHVVLSNTGYPLLDLDGTEVGDPAVVHGLIRQESGFDATARSHAGARGLMQLMPATARQTARRTGLRYDGEWLTGDPAYNVAIGSAHLAELLERFDNHLPLALAAYNAGGHRARQWIAEFGDPRGQPLAEQIDWIESIPYPETRNYIQRVLENAAVYRQRTTGRPVAVSLYADLSGAGGTR